MMTTQKGTRFSVIVPVYNMKSYLNDAVQSVLEQTLSDYEIILVDDGSTDGSEALCDVWAKKDARIRAFHQKNSGQIAARERGIQNAQGEFVLFLDSDDYLTNNALEILDEEIKATNADCIIFGYQKVENGLCSTKCCDKEKTVITNPDEFVRKICCDSSYNSMCRKAIRRNVTLGNDYSQFTFLRHGEDLIQTLLILMKCQKVVFIDSVLYNYRMVSSSVSHNRRIVDFSDGFAARECALAILQGCDWLSEYTMKRFKEYSTKKFVENLLNLLFLDMPDSEKNKAFHRIKSLSWNLEYISKSPELKLLSFSEKVIFQLFEKGATRLLIYIVNLKKIL